MKIEVRKKIGDSVFSFEVDEKDEIESLFKAGVLASAPTKCGICKSENISLSGNKAQGYTFVKVLCRDCNARSQLGQYKDGGFFWKRWEKYTPSAKEEEVPPEEE